MGAHSYKEMGANQIGPEKSSRVESNLIRYICRPLRRYGCFRYIEGSWILTVDDEPAVRGLETIDSDACPLSHAQIQQFIRDGYLKIERAFPRDLADQGRSILWRDMGCDEGGPTTWTKAVIRLGIYEQEPFARAANTPVLHKAFDQLVGPGRWLSRTSLGTFPVRFPTSYEPGDAGWHVDTSFPPETADPDDFLNWHVNVTSKGRALLMLFLFSDVGENDAPTRIRVASHVDVTRMLAPAGENGRSLRELAANDFVETVTTGGPCDRRGGYGLLVPSVSGTRSSAASRHSPALSCPATPSTGRTFPTRPRRWRLHARRASHQARFARSLNSAGCCSVQDWDR
jgi:hypothetical protein